MANRALLRDGLVVTGSVEVQNAITASAFSGDGSGLTGVGTVTDISYLATTASNSFISDQTITGSVVATGDSSRVRFLASALSDLPSATDNHGMFAHVHATGLGYYAHAGNWIPLATSESVATIDVTPPSTYFNSSLLTTENISKNFNYTSSLNVVEITSSVEGAIIDYRLTNLNSGSRVGTFYYAHDGTNLSYNDLTVPGAGIGSDPNLSATLTGSIVSIDIENAAGFNFSGFAKKFSKLSNTIIIADPNVSYLLDTYSGAAAAYSLRQLSQFYTGSAIRVREDSSNTETDIGFDINGNLNTAAISTHCGSNNGYVTIWYDQSGNGNNVEQTTAGNQPQIYNGSTINLENGKPILVGGYGLISNTYTSSTNQTLFSVIKGNGDATLISDNNGRLLISDHQTGVLPDYGYPNVSYYVDTQLTSFASRGEVQASIEGNQRSITTLYGDPLSSYLRLGNNVTSPAYDMQELIIYPNQTISRTDIETNINNHYSIYATGLLEDYSDAQFAFSVRQLTTAATSSIEIRRASDNTETTIGFTSNGDLDTGSIETFCNGTECVVVKWYDQTGNNRDATQTNTIFQPTIYSGSTVITFNGIPAATNAYYNYNDKFTITNTLGVPDSGSFTVSYVNNFYGAGGTAFTPISGIGDRTNRLITYMPGYAGINGTYARSSDHADHAIIYRKSGSEANTQGAYYNGNFTSENTLNGQAAYNPSIWQLPPQTPTYMHEIIFWPSNLSGSGATDVMDNVNSYFNIY